MEIIWIVIGIVIAACVLYTIFVGDSPFAAFSAPAVDVQWFPSPGGLLALAFWVGVIAFVCVSCGFIKLE